MDKQEEYEEKIPRTCGQFPVPRQTKGKTTRIRGCFSGGFCSVSVKISCLAHLSEERQALALASDPCKAACIAARRSHATGVKGKACKEVGSGNTGIQWSDSSFFPDPCKLLVA